MMLAATLRSVLTEAAAIIGALTVIGTGLAMTARLRPLRWVWRRLVAMPFAGWCGRVVTEATADLRQSMAEHRAYVGHHLGPNGSTPPIHQRLTDVQRRLGAVEDELHHPTVED